MKNNSAKLARWTAQSILSGADVMTLGYVSRVNRLDSESHAILMSQFLKPREFAQQLSVSTTNMWGILKMLVDKFLTLSEGKYLLVRDPNKASLRIYKVPDETFSEGDE